MQKIQVNQGGTGLDTATGILVGDGINPFLTITDGTVGQFLKTDGAGGYTFETVTAVASVVGGTGISVATLLGVATVTNDLPGFFRDADDNVYTSALGAGANLDISGFHGFDNFLTGIDAGGNIVNSNEIFAIGRNAARGAAIVNGTISTFADSGTEPGVKTTVTLASGSTPVNTQQVTITGTTNYNSTYTVSNVVIGVSFDINTVFTANDATGNFSSDSAIGYYYNMAVGFNAMPNWTFGGSNTAIGNLALFNLNTGTGNIALGYTAGQTVTTGSSNVLIGGDVSVGTISGSIALGGGALADSNNLFALPDTITNWKFGGNSYVLPTTFGAAGSTLTDTTGAGDLSFEAGMITAKVSLTNAEVAALDTTPFSLLPAPGAGKYYEVLATTASKPAGTAWTLGAAAQLELDQGSGAYDWFDFDGINFFDQASATIKTFKVVSDQVFLSNNAVLMQNIGTPLTGGTGGMDIYITYKIVTL